VCIVNVETLTLILLVFLIQYCRTLLLTGCCFFSVVRLLCEQGRLSFECTFGQLLFSGGYCKSVRGSVVSNYGYAQSLSEK